MDARRSAPATLRNREPILEVLRRFVPSGARVLEIAAGSGEHACFFAARLPVAEWQPTDPDPDSRASIDAWRTQSGVAALRPALALDVTADPWPVAHADAVVCINMIHISPWRATEGLVRGAARVLSAGGLLYCYGPYRRDGRHTADSNAAFDRDLRARNAEWGVRDLEDITALATEAGFAAPIVEPMPANNLSLVFRRLP